jgi:dephospho-CoA kinase
MLNVGLSGNIGAGKSTVARWLREWGATLIDSDELVREVQLPGSETLSAIARRFGADILKPDGSLDRDVLRTRAMRDAQTLTALNEIVHPAVQQLRAERSRLAAERGDCVLVSDIPLLFEVLDPGDFDVVVLVDAPVALRRERIMEERGLSHEVAQRMIDAQLPAAEKRNRSGIVLDNDGSLEELESVTLAAWRDIRRHAAVALTRKTGLLLAVATDPREAVHAFGGTLARYGDTGVETWLAYVGSHASAGVAQPLRLGGTVILDEKEAAGEVERVIRQRRPDVTVAVSPALSDTVRGAWDAAGSPGTLFHTARAGATVDARLDVRPWRDVRSAALEALGVTDGTAASEVPDRETFTAAVPVKQVLVDLFQTAD